MVDCAYILLDFLLQKISQISLCSCFFFFPILFVTEKILSWMNVIVNFVFNLPKSVNCFFSWVNHSSIVWFSSLSFMQ